MKSLLKKFKSLADSSNKKMSRKNFKKKFKKKLKKNSSRKTCNAEVQEKIPRKS